MLSCCPGKLPSYAQLSHKKQSCWVKLFCKGNLPTVQKTLLLCEQSCSAWCWLICPTVSNSTTTTTMSRIMLELSTNWPENFQYSLNFKNSQLEAILESAHRRRITTEEKAKVVAAVWGTELIRFLAMLAILHQDDLKKGMNSSYSSCRPGAIHPTIHPILQIVLVQNSQHGKEMN